MVLTPMMSRKSLSMGVRIVWLIREIMNMPMLLNFVRNSMHDYHYRETKKRPMSLLKYRVKNGHMPMQGIQRKLPTNLSG